MHLNFLLPTRAASTAVETRGGLDPAGRGVVMAKTCAVAFGRYLRILRERLGLSLDEAEFRSRAFPNSFVKGYLSRCENGRMMPAAAKLPALRRVYGISSEALLERLELDQEAYRRGSPPAEGRSYSELAEQGARALGRGRLWDAYVFLRDAMPLAADAPLIPGMESSREQSLCAVMNLSSAAAALGRANLALHELLWVTGVGGPGPRWQGVFLGQLAEAWRAVGRRSDAEACARRGLAEADRAEVPCPRGYLLSSLARLAFEEERWSEALDYYLRAFRAHQASGRRTEEIRVLLQLARTYLEIGRVRPARSSLDVVMRSRRSSAARPGPRSSGAKRSGKPGPSATGRCASRRRSSCTGRRPRWVTRLRPARWNAGSYGSRCGFPNGCKSASRSTDWHTARAVRHEDGRKARTDRAGEEPKQRPPGGA
jgi:tetratricopeptide (TPR) repeat protein